MPYRVKITVIDVGKKFPDGSPQCPYQAKLGDTLVIDNDHFEGRLCPLSFNIIYPFAFGAYYGGSRFLWSVPYISDTADPKKLEFVCPDHSVQVRYTLDVEGLGREESMYTQNYRRLLEIINEKPGIPVAQIKDEFSEEEKMYYHMDQARIQHRIEVYIWNLAEAGKVIVSDNKVYPAKEKTER